jgi:hypothetical protein
LVPRSLTAPQRVGVRIGDRKLEERAIVDRLSFGFDPLADRLLVWIMLNAEESPEVGIVAECCCVGRCVGRHHGPQADEVAAETVR